MNLRLPKESRFLIHAILVPVYKWSLQITCVSTFKYEAAGLFPDGCFKDFFRPPKVILGRPNYVDAPKPFDDPGWNPIPAVRD